MDLQWESAFFVKRAYSNKRPFFPHCWRRAKKRVLKFFFSVARYQDFCNSGRSRFGDGQKQGFYFFQCRDFLVLEMVLVLYKNEKYPVLETGKNRFFTFSSTGIFWYWRWSWYWKKMKNQKDDFLDFNIFHFEISFALMSLKMSFFFVQKRLKSGSHAEKMTTKKTQKWKMSKMFQIDPILGHFLAFFPLST